MFRHIEITERRLVELRVCPTNPRICSLSEVAAQKAIMLRFGFIAPIVIDEQGYVLEGHARLEAAKQLGRKTVPTICLGHLSVDERLAYTIASYRVMEMGFWNISRLVSALEALMPEKFAPTETT